MEGRVGQVGQAVGGGPRAATQRRADLFGSRDGDDRPPPGHQAGQNGGLGWGAERGGNGRRGGAEGGCLRWFNLSPLLFLLYTPLSGSDGDGLDGCSMNDGWKMTSWARKRGID